MNAKTPSPAGDPIAAEAILAAPPGGIDIREFARLGAEASAIDLRTVDVPADIPGLPKTVPVAIVNGKAPEARSIQRLLEEYRLRPARRKGQATAQTFEAFCALVNRHKTADSVIFADADWKKPSFTAVIDYHENAGDGRPDFGQHRVHYAFPLSEEWKKWVEMNGEPMKQGEFAWFLEDRVAELASPTDDERIRYEHDFQTRVATPAQVVELSRGLQVRVDARFKGQTTLQTGEGQIAWEETHNDADGKPLKVPGIFMLAIAPFFMGEKMRVPVRLRYRPAGQEVKWFYQIYRPDLAITEHIRTTLAEARNQTDLPAFEGTPEMSGS